MPKYLAGSDGRHGSQLHKIGPVRGATRRRIGRSPQVLSRDEDEQLEGVVCHCSCAQYVARTRLCPAPQHAAIASMSRTHDNCEKPSSPAVVSGQWARSIASRSTAPSPPCSDRTPPDPKIVAGQSEKLDRMLLLYIALDCF